MKSIFYFTLVVISVFIINSCKEDNPITPNTIDLAPPTNVQLELEQGGVIRIRWQVQSKGQTGFRIERKNGINGKFSNIISTTGSIEFVLDSTARYVDSLYYYRIAAYKGEQIGKYSEETSINLAFPAPSNLTINQANDFEVSLSWSGNSIIEVGFQIERKEGSGLFQVIDSVSSGVTTYVDTQKIIGETSFFYRIKAFAKSFLSAQSNQVNVVTEFRAPTNLITTFNSEERITLTWQDNTINENNFIIELSEAGGAFNRLDTIPLNTTTYQFNKIHKVNQNYTFRVFANSFRRYSKFSNAPTVKLEFKRPKLTVSEITESNIKLDWIDSTSFENNFELFRRIGSTGNFDTVSTTIQANATSFNHSFSVKTNTNYFYRIRAKSPKGNYSDFSTDSVNLIFAAPSNLQLLTNSENSFTIQWRDNSNYELGFIIERINLSMNNKRDSILLPANTTEYEFVSLDKTHQYQFRIRAYTSKNFSDYSNGIKVGFALTSLISQWRIADTLEYHTVDLTNDGQAIIVGGDNGIAKVLDSGGNQQRILIPDIPSLIRCLAISPDNQKVAIGHDDGLLRIWRINDGQLLNSTNTNSTILSLDWNSSSSTIVTAHSNQLIYLRNASTGSVNRTLSGHSSEVNSVKYFKDTLIVSGSSDRNLILWLASNGSQIIKVQNAHGNKINSVDYLANDRTVLLSAGADGLVKIWKASDGSNIATIGAPYSNNVIGADLRSIISAGGDKLIKIWRYPDGNLVHSNSVHTDLINAIAVDTSLKYLICSSRDKTYSLWKLVSEWVEIK